MKDGQYAADDFGAIRRRVLELEQEQTWRAPAPLGEQPVERVAPPKPHTCDLCGAASPDYLGCQGYCCG